MSKIKWTFVLLIALASGNAALAQNKPAEPPKTDVPKIEAAKTAEKLTAKDYEEMLAKVKKGDLTVDFGKLRLAYTETKDYSPYDGGDERGKMQQAFGEKKYKEALEVANEILKTNYVSLPAQLVAFQSNAELGKSAEAEHHRNVYRKLWEAVTTNNGRTGETAIISLGVSEQYYIMAMLGFGTKSKSLVRENGSMFDVHTATNSETKETRKFYFNIDKVFGRLF